jgi:hypothetical protein
VVGGICLHQFWNWLGDLAGGQQSFSGSERSWRKKLHSAHFCVKAARKIPPAGDGQMQAVPAALELKTANLSRDGFSSDQTRAF